MLHFRLHHIKAFLLIAFLQQHAAGLCLFRHTLKLTYKLMSRSHQRELFRVSRTFQDCLSLHDRKSKSNHPIQSQGKIHCENKQHAGFVDLMHSHTRLPREAAPLPRKDIPHFISFTYLCAIMIRWKSDYKVNTQDLRQQVIFGVWLR